MKDWNLVRLGDVLIESKVESPNPDSNRRIRVKLNVGGVEKRPDTKDREGATRYFIRKTNQFIYGRQNLHKGAFGIVPADLDGYESSSDIPAFDVVEGCLPEWIYYFFKQGDFYLKLEPLAKGVGSKRISTSRFFELKIPLPPLDQQNKIIEQIKSVENQSWHLSGEISHFENLVKKLKKNVYQDAIQGKLTNSWRSNNKKIETGSLLLKQIINEKQKLIKEKKIKQGRKQLPIQKNDVPFKIPTSWAWCRYADLSEPGGNVSYGVLIPEEHVSSGIPLIRVGDIDGAESGKMPSKYISKTISSKYIRTQLKGGEILIVVVGASIGKAAIVPENWRGANIARAVSRTSVNAKVSSKYLYYAIQSAHVQKYFNEMTHSVGQPTLNINVIENAIIPLPPALEQEAIVEKIEILLDISLNLERQLVIAGDKLKKFTSTALTEILDLDDFDFEIFEIQPKRVIVSNSIISFSDTFDNNITTNNLMELEEILKENGKMSAIQLWRASKFLDDIDAFYENVKQKIEVDKVIKESTEKGFLELVK